MCYTRSDLLVVALVGCKLCKEQQARCPDASICICLYLALKAFLEAEAPGQKVLYIGCGSRDWACLAV